MSIARDFSRILAEIDDLNEVCAAFRQAHLQADPAAKPNKAERLYSDALAYVQRRYGVDLTPR
jgi:hypothetical protein